LFWVIIRSQLNLRKLYSIIYINYTVKFPQIQLWPADGPEQGPKHVVTLK